MEIGVKNSGSLSLFAKIEAVLFAYAEPISISKLADVLRLSVLECKNKLSEFAKNMNADENRGIMLVFLDDSVQLISKKEASGLINMAIEKARGGALTAVAMEVLAIIAYNQPVTKGFIEKIRGTNSNSVGNSLVEKKWVEEAGRLDIPGKPIGYKTTKTFLRSFGLSDLSQLPPLDGLQEKIVIAQGGER